MHLASGRIAAVEDLVLRLGRLAPVGVEPDASLPPAPGRVRRTIMAIQPIVVGFDGTPDATTAAVRAGDEAAHRGAAVRLVYAWFAAVKR